MLPAPTLAVEALDADRPEELTDGRRHLVLPGDERWAVKDPVVVASEDGWQLWLCCHPLTEVAAEDPMVTRHLTSPDGLRWSNHAWSSQVRRGSGTRRGHERTRLVGRHHADLGPRTCSTWAP